MKKASVLVLVVMVIALLAGCTTTMPGGISGVPLGDKTGEATATFLFGFPLNADAGIATAAANGGITTVTSYDLNVWWPVIPVYTKVTTIVTGN